MDICPNLDLDKIQQVLNILSYTIAVQEARKSAYMIPTALGLYRVHDLEDKNELSKDLIKQMHLIVADSVLVATNTDGISASPWKTTTNRGEVLLSEVSPRRLALKEFRETGSAPAVV